MIKVGYSYSASPEGILVIFYVWLRYGYRRFFLFATTMEENLLNALHVVDKQLFLPASASLRTDNTMRVVDENLSQPASSNVELKMSPDF